VAYNVGISNNKKTKEGTSMPYYVVKCSYGPYEKFYYREHSTHSYGNKDEFDQDARVDAAKEFGVAESDVSTSEVRYNVTKKPKNPTAKEI